MVHRGELLEEAVRQSGISLAEVARRMGKSRRHLYNLFEDPHVSVEVILQIGKVIHHDFTANKKLFGNLSPLSVFDVSGERQQGEQSAHEDAVYWKNKYLTLLEKYNALLEKHIK
jgi:transcriptional regulator with XRE-family HTH domain